MARMNFEVARVKIASVLDFALGHPTDRKRAAAVFCSALVLGTALAWLVSLAYPLLSRSQNGFQLYVKSNLPRHSLAEVVVVLICFLLMGVLLALPWKWWRSLRHGLVGFGLLGLGCFCAWLLGFARCPSIPAGTVHFSKRHDFELGNQFSAARLCGWERCVAG